MKLEQSFEVDLPLDRVWEALVDVERVAPCLPGAAVTGRNEDGSYSGIFTIKIGPTTASYAGTLEMQNLDEAAHTAKMHAQGADRRGQGGATATIESTLSPHNGGTRVEVVTDYHITGRLARFGRGGMIEDISQRLLREFAGRLQSSLAEAGGPGAGAAADATETPTRVAEQAAQVAEQPPPAGAAADAGEQPTVEQPRLIPDEEATPAPTEAAAPPPSEAAPPPPPEAAPPSPPPPPAEEPVEPLNPAPVVGSVVLARIRRIPAPVVAIVGGLIVLGLVRRRR